jgi:hypothetical protein
MITCGGAGESQGVGCVLASVCGCGSTDTAVICPSRGDGVGLWGLVLRQLVSTACGILRGWRWPLTWQRPMKGYTLLRCCTTGLHLCRSVLLSGPTRSPWHVARGRTVPMSSAAGLSQRTGFTRRRTEHRYTSSTGKFNCRYGFRSQTDRQSVSYIHWANKAHRE